MAAVSHARRRTEGVDRPETGAPDLLPWADPERIESAYAEPASPTVYPTLLELPVSNLKVSDVRPFLPTKDFALSKRFYASLGWDTKDVADGLALVRFADEQHLYLQDYYVQEIAENCMLHLTVADAQAWYRHVASVLHAGNFPGARVQPPKLQPYGALVTFVHDPSGVLLHLCQWMSGAPAHA